MKTFLLIAFALLISWADNARAEVIFGNAGPGKDGRTYRYVTFRIDVKTALATKSDRLDNDWRAKVILSADGKASVSGLNPAETEIYVGGQLTNKKDSDPDIGLTWNKSNWGDWNKMRHLGNGVYEVTVPLLDGAAYGYKFMVWDKKDLYGAWSKDPDNPKVEPEYGNSQITVTAPVTTTTITR